MFSKLLLGGVTASLVAGHFCYQKEKKYTDLFSRMEVCPTLDFDYIQSLDELPVNKDIALCAEIDPEMSKIKTSQFNPKKKVVFSTATLMNSPSEKKVTKETLQNENEAFDEYFINLKNPEIPKFYLRNVRQEKIEVIWSTALQKEVGFFNVKPIAFDLDPSKVPTYNENSLQERINKYLNPKAKLAEIGLEADEKYMYVGELQKADASRLKDGVYYVFKPKYVLGESRDFFLRYADGQVVKYHKRGKSLLIAASIMTVCHFGLKYAYPFISSK